MVAQPESCERSCSWKKINQTTQLIVLTGGPGAGKTAVLEFVKKVMCEHVAIFPEAASILFKGGFWRLNSTEGKKAAQRAIFHVQNEMQKLVLAENQWSVGLCDRGTLDGLAYWPGTESDFFAELETTMEREYQRFSAVIHLRSPTLAHGYNHQNPMRIESAELAAKIDEKIHQIWKAHPNYRIVESTESFVEKVFQASKHLQTFVPECCRQHFENTKS